MHTDPTLVSSVVANQSPGSGALGTGDDSIRSQPAEALPSFSEKDRKAEILKAYEELKDKYERKAVQAKDRKETVRRREEQGVLDQAAALTPAVIVQTTAKLEQQVHGYLDDIAAQMQQQAERLQSLRQAVELQQRRLKEVHDIAAEADSLAELIDTHRLKKLELEQAIDQRREQWQREQEDYRYETEQRRRREIDAYEQMKAERERELAERETALRERERSFEEVIKRAKTFDQELRQMEDRVREQTEQRVRSEEQGKAALLAEQVKRQSEVDQVRLQSLLTRADEDRREIAELRRLLDVANREAKEIAIKVIEGRSGAQAMRRQAEAEARTAVASDRQARTGA